MVANNKNQHLDPNQLYKEFNLAIPIDPLEIAKHLNIEVTEKFNMDRLGYSGEISWPNGNPVIWINRVDPPTRRRFTLAHELGHYFLHQNKSFHDDIQAFFRNNVWDGKEYEANNFAAALLMPEDKVREKLQKVKDELKAQTSKFNLAYICIRAFSHNGINKDALVEKMANTFEVSPQAMTYRLKNLGILT